MGAKRPAGRRPQGKGRRRHRSKSDWLSEHHGDCYVQQARRSGFRSRAAYKLLQLDERDRLFRPGMVVLDLGAAPGGWSQVAAARVGEQGRMIAMDRLALDPLEGVEVLTADIEDEEVVANVLDAVGKHGADLVISDMAPNISGMNAIDQPRSIYLAELAVDLGHKVLKSGGDILIKMFQGGGFDAFVEALRRDFSKVVIRKPRASRARSREVYVLARGFCGGGAEGRRHGPGSSP